MTVTKLALKGGGAKGYVYVGVYQALEELGLLPGLDTIAGSSVGAIAALLMATGKSSAQLKAILYEANFENMLYDCWTIKGAYNLIEYGGLHQGEHFTQWFESIIESVTGSKTTTFQEWHDFRLAHPELNLKDMVFEACNMATTYNDVFAWNTKLKDTPIAKALRASMSVPIVLTPELIGEIPYEDGGIQANCPITVFNLEDNTVNPEALAVFLENHDIIDYLLNHKELPSHIPKTLYQRAQALIEASLNTQTYDVLASPYKDKTILCDTLGVGTLDFNLSNEMKDKMCESGYQAVIGFFKKCFAEHAVKQDESLSVTPNLIIPAFEQMRVSPLKTQEALQKTNETKEVSEAGRCTIQ